MSCAAFSFELEYKVDNSDSKTTQNDDHGLDTEEDLCDKTADHQQNVKCATSVDYISGEVPYHVKDDCRNTGTHNLQCSRDDLVEGRCPESQSKNLGCRTSGNRG